MSGGGAKGWEARTWTSAPGTLVAVLVLYFAVPLEERPSPVRLVLELTLTLAAVGWVALVIAREARRQRTGADDGLRGRHLALLLELTVVLFALAYYLLAVHGSHQVVGIATRLDALYFTVSTMATVGYGDIHATGQLARGVAVAHIVFDVVFLATAARLVARAWGRGGAGVEQDHSDVVLDRSNEVVTLEVNPPEEGSP